MQPSCRWAAHTLENQSRQPADLWRYMPQQNRKPPIASTLATLAGCAIVFGSLLLTLAFPRLHLGIAIAIGAVLGTPFIVLGLRLHPPSIAADGPSKQFWPTRREARGVLWGFVAFVTLCACILGPLGIVIAVGVFLPAGDTWGIVAVRLLFIGAAVLAWYWWVKFAATTIPNWFRGRLSDETLDAITRDEPSEEPKTAKAAAIKYWQVAAIALVAFCVGFGVIDFHSPWLNIDAGPKRTHGLVRLLQWCRGNPNTVTSSSILVGAAALAWYIFQVCRVVAKPNATLSRTRHVTKP